MYDGAERCWPQYDTVKLPCTCSAWERVIGHQLVPVDAAAVCVHIECVAEQTEYFSSSSWEWLLSLQRNIHSLGSSWRPGDTPSPYPAADLQL